MECPKCQCKEISASGICLWCGYQVTAQTAGSDAGTKEKQEGPGSTETGDSQNPNAPDQENLPAWRQELAQRLQSLKEEHEASLKADATQPETRIIPESESPPGEPQSPAQSKSESTTPSDGPVRTESQQSDENRDSVPESTTPKDAGSTDAAPDSKATALGNAGSPTNRIPDKIEQMETTAEAATFLFRAHTSLNRDETWMILLFRTIAGAVDLGLMAIFTVVLIVAADFFSGIQLLDLRSFIHYSALLLFSYFLYSAFFLTTIAQTIGMMITNLHVVSGTGGKRPHPMKTLARCICYLLSILCLGIGLIWALFDHDHLCLHDRLTDTRVVPVFSSPSQVIE